MTDETQHDVTVHHDDVSPPFKDEAQQLDIDPDSAIELILWPKAHGLASADPECLCLAAYLRFLFDDGKVIFQNLSNPFAANAIPHVKVRCKKSDSTLTLDGCNAEHIIRQLVEKNVIASGAMDHPDSYVLSTMIRCKLQPLFDWLWWGNDECHRRLARPYYGDNLAFYYSLTWPPLQRRDRLSRLAHLVVSCDEDDASASSTSCKRIEDRAIAAAVEAMDDLAQKLSGKQFLLDTNRPSFVDAQAFSVLAPILLFPWRHAELRNQLYCEHLGTFRKLLQYVERIADRYFPEVIRQPMTGTNTTEVVDDAKPSSFAKDAVGFGSLFLLVNGYLLWKSGRLGFLLSKLPLALAKFIRPAQESGPDIESVVELYEKHGLPTS